MDTDPHWLQPKKEFVSIFWYISSIEAGADMPAPGYGEWEVVRVDERWTGGETPRNLKIWKQITIWWRIMQRFLLLCYNLFESILQLTKMFNNTFALAKTNAVQEVFDDCQTVWKEQLDLIDGQLSLHIEKCAEGSRLDNTEYDANSSCEIWPH